MDGSSVAEVPEVHDASIFRVEVTRVGECSSNYFEFKTHIFLHFFAVEKWGAS
jgi:hypothetical protein